MTIDILGIKWDIVETDATPENLFGRCDFTNARIVLKSGLQADTVAQTLIHEICHVIADELGITLHEDEQTITALSTGIFAVCRANPELADILFGLEEKASFKRKKAA